MEPNEIIVLGAIKRGAKKFGKIHSQTKIESKEINEILKKLERYEMIKVYEKKGWLGKSIEIHATHKGQQELESRIGQMQEDWGKMVELQKNGDPKKLKGFMDDNKSFLPMMMFFGVIDMMMFSAMFSMIGTQAGDYIPADQMPDTGTDAGDLDFDIGF
ncbi:MAG: putative membrane protein [Cenarchaeum symbiont of Oopsacas minuta]|nr:putative membrane protein [Cenarchaeum symbiont of Oopsacas minuta]